mgnify:CR=1 FL=1
MHNYYDSISGGYDELHGEEQRRKAKLVLDLIKLKKTVSFLDIGGGTGYATEIFPGKRVVLEPSKGLREKVKGISVAGMAEKLPFPNKSFTLAICLTAIHHFKDPKKALQEMKRVSKKYVAVSLLKKAKNYEKLNELIKKELPKCEIIDDEHDVIYLLEK